MCESRTETALRKGIVIANEMVGSDLWRLALAVEDWQGPGPLPGQFIMLRVSEGSDPLLARPFGVAGFERDRTAAYMEIIYRVVGRGTALMSTLAADHVLRFLGPVGRGFELPEAGSRSVLVAGGVGLPPLLFLARFLVDQGRGSELSLVYGETTRDRLLDLDHRIIPAIDVAVCTEDGTCGEKGLVTDLVAEHLNGRETCLYVCGPAPMLAAVHAMTPDHHKRSWYSLEARMACGFGVCSGCAVMTSAAGYVRVCVEGPVFRGDQLSEESFA